MVSALFVASQFMLLFRDSLIIIVGSIHLIILVIMLVLIAGGE
jgi:hypothetical protein